tara:strand:- start:1956 stop:2063 length:108 start_codon:yes stop_codon:yes gene_type:complete
MFHKNILHKYKTINAERKQKSGCRLSSKKKNYKID